MFEKEVFDQVLHFVMEELAKKIAADGEGAGKLMTVTVNGVDISFKSNDEILCCESGKGLDFDEEKAKSILLQEEIEIICDMHSGNESCTCWGCDLTYDYVKINGDYRT